jgi:hypothetical protein
MSEAQDRGARLQEFARARDQFEQAYQAVPDDALTYVPEGDDYTLGGLAVHVTDALYHYSYVLDVLKQSGYGPQARVVDPVDDAKQRRDAMVAHGFAGNEKAGVFREMRSAHEALAAKISAVPEAEYTREAPILYGADTQEPYTTKAADVIGWVIDHYNDHTKQVGELLERWSGSKSS